MRKLLGVVASVLLVAGSGPHATPTWSAPARTFYVDPDSPAAAALRADPGDGAAARIAAVPQARWFTEATPDVAAAVDRYVRGATAAGAMPVLVTCAVPGRDCGSFSAGGLPDTTAYATWIRAVRADIAQRPAMVVVEPDALVALDCLDSGGRGPLRGGRGRGGAAGRRPGNGGVRRRRPLALARARRAGRAASPRWRARSCR